MRKIIDFLVTNIPIIFIVLIIISVGFLISLMNVDKKYVSLDVKLESVSKRFNSNKIKLSYDDTGEIKEVVLKTDNNEITMHNGSVFELKEDMDGKKVQLRVFVYYKDGSVETFSKNYQLYNECYETINRVEKTSCSNNDDKYFETKIFVDKITKKTCKKEVKEHKCTHIGINNGHNNLENSDNIESSSGSGNSNNSGVDSNKGTVNDKGNSSNKGTSNNTPENSKSRGCNLVVSKGTIGLNSWYVSNVTLTLKISGSDVSKYGITTSTKSTYNSKKSLSITSEHGLKKYYGYVKYKDGTTKSCNISLKIDKTKPTVPTSVIKKNDSNGEVINNSSSYRNYKVWWGNYNGIDKGSGIDHYEYSYNCTGSKTGTLRSEYIYPLEGKDFYNRTYCIRSVDAAGNYSNWSSGYHFNIDLVKPTCSVSMTSASGDDILTVSASDSHSGVSSYSYNNSSYISSSVYKIKKGTKVTVAVKDKAGNIGNCVNYKKALILVGDSRTYWLQNDVGGKRILTNYEDIYFVESYDGGYKEVYAVAKSGATKNWLLGTKGYYDSGAYQVQYLLSYLSNKSIYYDVKIASNLGVNDLNYYDLQTASNIYNSAYNNFLNSSQNVIVDDKTVSTNWRKTGNVIDVSFNFISVNPIDEKLLNAYTSANTRTLTKINNYNSIMKQTYGSRYLDAYSNFNNWFNQAVKAGQFRYSYRTCVDSNNNKYSCEDGLHYSPYVNKNCIYPFYKNKLLG